MKIPAKLEKWIMRHPKIRDVVFWKRMERQKVLTKIFTSQKTGCNAYLCLSLKPTQEEVKEMYQCLCKKTDANITIIRNTYPAVREISKDRIHDFSKVWALKSMVTYYDEMYLVSFLIMFHKNKDGTWIPVAGDIEDSNPPVFKDYPEDIEVAFSGGFGDDVYLKESEFMYSSTRFLAL